MHWRRPKPQPKDSFEEQIGPDPWDVRYSLFEDYVEADRYRHAHWRDEIDRINNTAVPMVGYYDGDRYMQAHWTSDMYPSQTWLYRASDGSEWKYSPEFDRRLPDKGNWRRIGGPTRLPIAEYTGAFPDCEVERWQ